ncbi:MAG TPA: glycosyltransferase [Bryobacteraceae bacterium]|nr:glycosyltransferase [Bryobacteraceae bacterium]
MTARIALLTTNLARGGAETQVALLATGLRRRGWDVSVVSLVKPTALEAELVAESVPVYSLDMQPGVWNPLGFVRLATILRRLRPQILHGHMFHANLLARLARLLCPLPVVVSTLHSAAETSRRSSQMRRRDWAYRLTDPLGDVTVAVSVAVAARHTEARAVRAGKLRIIPNGVDTSRFRPDAARRQSARHLLGLGEEFTWLAVGRLMWKKGYGPLLHSFAGLGQGIMLVAGAGPQEGQLRELASELGANVRFLGERADIADLMPAADAFVQASLVEGMPVSLLEAAACGLPSVTTGAGGAAEVVSHQRTGYVVPPGNADALAAAMSRLMNLPAGERQAMGLAARHHVVERYEAGAMLARWEQLYGELLAKWT